MIWTTSCEPDRFFGAAERMAIGRAAESAEAGTSGEVVSYVVGRCDDYPGAGWLAAAWGSVLAAVVSGTYLTWGRSWGGSDALWVSISVVMAAILGYVLALISTRLRRFLVSDQVMARRVGARAATAFVEEEVFNTRDRTGILIFVAIFEHRVVVLADEGINSKVEQREWDDIVAHVIEGIRRRHPAAALVEAIGACGRLLHERRVERRPDDSDELHNELRTSSE